MKVRCINDDWSNLPKGHPAQIVLSVGDPLPEKGKEYEVIGYAHLEDANGKAQVGYELAGLDYSNYPFQRMVFLKSRFEISDETFVPNTVTEDGFPARQMNMYVTYNFPMSKVGKMPRKMKKRFKKYGIEFIHPKAKLIKP